MASEFQQSVRSPKQAIRRQVRLDRLLQPEMLKESRCRAVNQRAARHFAATLMVAAGGLNRTVQRPDEAALAGCTPGLRGWMPTEKELGTSASWMVTVSVHVLPLGLPRVTP